MLDNSDITKWFVAAFAAVLSWIGIAYRNNNTKHDAHNTKLSEHDKEIAVVKIQMTTIISKIEDLADLGSRIEGSNKTILRALARKSNNSNK